MNSFIYLNHTFNYIKSHNIIDANIYICEKCKCEILLYKEYVYNINNYKPFLELKNINGVDIYYSILQLNCDEWIIKNIIE